MTDTHRDIAIPTALLLHFAPAVAVGTGYLLFASVATPIGLPRTAALLAAFLLVGIPVQLTVIRKVSQAVGHSAVHYQVQLPLWQHILGALGLIAIGFGLLQLPLGRVSEYLATHAFWWVPTAFSAAADNDLATTSRAILLPVLLFQLLIDGLINPLVEERYFRGFLLSQLEGLGAFAPVVNTAFFALGHVWQPHNYVSIFVYVLPLTFFTWWRKNYYVQAFVHCLANSIGATLALAAFVRGF